MTGHPHARPSSSSAVTVSKVGYIGFQTPDVARLVDYYTRVLDFVVVDHDPDRAYLTTVRPIHRPRARHVNPVGPGRTRLYLPGGGCRETRALDKHF